ncbi:hypothetical protein GRI58_15085 [Porphyrobacter algicida]|uniref:Uncharacterized protein n=1 Tax=Qipengyuania algicida TaxID=1836209 RepID=A0A845AHL6_9SPHN|nr:hypothetical protein [Qipengyuania algicida]MXP30132.1 hypothetical protein [Qipengyuania algicida]
MKLQKWLLVATSLMAMSSPAHALCVHNGELYAKTTLRQEYREARWVVRARVLSASNWENGEGSGTLYRLQVVRRFKGELPDQFAFSTERNSGGFYLDNESGKTDVGDDYLLFLVPNPRSASEPPMVRNSLWVNYSCGQSRRWSAVASADRAELAALSLH